MIKAIDVIDLLPDELAAALQSDPFFDDITVVVAERGNVLKTIQEKQSIVSSKGGKWGVAVVVVQLVADDELPEVAFGSLKLRPAFHVLEQPTQNNSKTGTGKSARKVARKIRDIIKPLALAGLCTEFIFERECILPLQLPVENLVGYEINCHTYECDTEKIDQVAAPQFVIAEDGSSVTLTCATAGATIYYTLDDSFPAPAAKVPGSTAVAAMSGAVIPLPQPFIALRAMAVRSGDDSITWINSQVNRLIEINP